MKTKGKRPLDDDGDVPDGLPEELPQEAAEKPKSALDVARFCPTCGQEARIVSNHLGVRAFCGPCKSNWMVGGPAVLDLPAALPRGLSKQTIIGPDVQLAYEDFEYDDEYKRSK